MVPPMARRLGKVVIVLLGAAAFGVAVSVLKGNDAGIRDAIGNLSAAWLLLPFVCGVLVGGGRAFRGAVVGMLATVTALTGFYVSNAFVLDLGLHPWLEDVNLAIHGEIFWLELGLFSGPIFGALGARWRRTRSIFLVVLITAFFVFEPLAWLAYLRTTSADASWEAVWVCESLLGLCGCVLAIVLGRRGGGARTQS
jgi:hypothetical protein